VVQSAEHVGREQLSDEVPVPWFGPRMVCTACGAIGADANWSERVAPDLMGGPGVIAECHRLSVGLHLGHIASSTLHNADTGGSTWRLTMMRLPLFGIASVLIGILVAPAEVSAKKSGSGQTGSTVKESAKIEQPNLARTTAKKKGTKGQTEYMTIKMDNPTITSRQVNPSQPKRPNRPGRPTFGN